MPLHMFLIMFSGLLAPVVTVLALNFAIVSRLKRLQDGEVTKMQYLAIEILNGATIAAFIFAAIMFKERFENFFGDLLFFLAEHSAAIMYVGFAGMLVLLFRFYQREQRKYMVIALGVVVFAAALLPGFELLIQRLQFEDVNIADIVLFDASVVWHQLFGGACVGVLCGEFPVTVVRAIEGGYYFIPFLFFVLNWLCSKPKAILKIFFAVSCWHVFVMYHVQQMGEGAAF